MDVMGWDVLCVFEMKKTRGKWKFVNIDHFNRYKAVMCQASWSLPDVSALEVGGDMAPMIWGPYVFSLLFVHSFMQQKSIDIFVQLFFLNINTERSITSLQTKCDSQKLWNVQVFNVDLLVAGIIGVKFFAPNDFWVAGKIHI